MNIPVPTQGYLLFPTQLPPHSQAIPFGCLSLLELEPSMPKMPTPPRRPIILFRRKNQIVMTFSLKRALPPRPTTPTSCRSISSKRSIDSKQSKQSRTGKSILNRFRKKRNVDDEEECDFPLGDDFERSLVEDVKVMVEPPPPPGEIHVGGTESLEYQRRYHTRRRLRNARKAELARRKSLETTPRFFGWSNCTTCGMGDFISNVIFPVDGKQEFASNSYSADGAGLGACAPETPLGCTSKSVSFHHELLCDSYTTDGDRNGARLGTCAPESMKVGQSRLEDEITTSSSLKSLPSSMYRQDSGSVHSSQGRYRTVMVPRHYKLYYKE